MNAKLTKLATAGLVMGLAVSGSAQAGVIAMADLALTSLILRNATTGSQLTATEIRIDGGGRFGTTSATLNGTNTASATGLVGPVDNADATRSCVGSCGGPLSALYGGTVENNTTTHIASPAAFNYAMGDMFVSGSAIDGGAAGLTRANTSITGPTNNANANGNIQNSISATAIFTATQNLTVDFSAGFDTFVKTFVDPEHYTNVGEDALATASTQFVLSLFDVTNNNSLVLSWLPSEFNKAFTTDTSVNGPEQLFSLVGSIDSENFLILAGHQYSLTITQNSQAGVRATVIPEPSSLALIGLGLLGLSRRVRRGGLAR